MAGGQDSGYTAILVALAVPYTKHLCLSGILRNDEIGDPCSEMVFATVVLAENVALNAGENVLQVFPSNNIAIPGTTYQSVAPMVDCLGITTSAVLIWDAVKGLPANNY